MSVANAVKLTASLSCYNPNSMVSSVGRSVTSDEFNQTASPYIESSVSVATSATAIPLGGVTSCGWAYFRNMDPTNYLTIRNGAGGADLAQLYPGESAWLPLITTCVPYAVANAGACLLEYMIFSR
jgi:hypothetical protein